MTELVLWDPILQLSDQLPACPQSRVHCLLVTRWLLLTKLKTLNWRLNICQMELLQFVAECCQTELFHEPSCLGQSRACCVLTVCSPGSEHVRLLDLICDQWSCWLFLRAALKSLFYILNWTISKWDLECGSLSCVYLRSSMEATWWFYCYFSDPGRLGRLILETDHGLLGDWRDVQTAGACWAPRIHLGEERSPQLTGSSLRLLHLLVLNSTHLWWRTCSRSDRDGAHVIVVVGDGWFLICWQVYNGFFFF